MGASGKRHWAMDKREHPATINANFTRLNLNPRHTEDIYFIINSKQAMDGRRGQRQMNEEHNQAIKRVLDYISENSGEKLNLERLAAVSGFSKYHFSRIFTAAVGMTPVAYVNRVRLQKAAGLLAQTDISILTLAGECGFESVSTFNALFKKHFGRTPFEVRKSRGQGAAEGDNRNFSEVLRNQAGEQGLPGGYNGGSTNHLLKRAWDRMITIRELPDYEVASVRHVGSYLDTGEAWDKLGRWAAEQGLTPGQCHFIGVSLDDGNFTEELACRYDACVSLPLGFERDGHEGVVEFQTLPGGLFATYSFYDTIDQFVLAYQHVYGLWLPNSDYVADDRPCLELCLNNPALDEAGKARIDLCVPIKARKEVVHS